MKTIIYKNYSITKLSSGTIQVSKNNQIISPTKPALRTLATELNLNIENKNGNLETTRSLGNKIIKTIETTN